MKKKPIIGLMIGNVNKNFSDEIAKGVLKYTDENNISTVMLLSSPIFDDEDGYNMDNIYFDNIYDYYKHLGIDSLIITYASIYDIQESKIKTKFLSKFKDIPYVLLQDNYFIDGKSNIFVNNKSGQVKCIEHLIKDHNYKKILFFSGPKENYDAKERLNAYFDTMKKYNLEVNDSMIAYGDFGKNIEEELIKLINNNKDVEAIVFANDTMAIASYPILEKMGYKIGKDIAITGFDDIEASSIIYPSLTTISQSPIELGYEAAKEAVRLLNKENQSIVLDTELIIRSSCGCPEKNTKNYIKSNDEIDNLIRNIINDTNKKYSIVFDKDYAYFKMKSIVNILNSNHDKKIALELLKDISKEYIKENFNYNEIIYDLFSELLSNINNSNNSIEYLMYEYQKWMYHYINTVRKNIEETLKEKSFWNSYMVKKLMNKRVSLEEIIKSIFKELKQLEVTSAYIYFNKKYNESLLYLKGYFDETKEEIYITKDKIINNNKKNILKSKESYAFPLASGDRQYGYILIQSNYEMFNSIKELCGQLNSLLYFNELRNSTKKAQKELEKSYKEIESKNIILNTISKYDELTQVYNRRGFIENAINILKENKNTELEILFCDLDHLKEINDCFGHKEGDFAISKIAETLKKILSNKAIIGRIGGDEFVALYEKKHNKNIYNNIKTTLTKFNKTSKLDYYIETSIGIIDFNSKEQTDILTLLNQADSILYEDKKKRKTTIKK